MNPQKTVPQLPARHGADDAQPFDRVPARTLLEALAKIYEFVLVTDSSGRVLWRSDGLVELCGGEGFRVGCEVKTLLPLLPGFTRPEQAFELRSRLRRDGFLTKAVIELSNENEESVRGQRRSRFGSARGAPVLHCHRAPHRLWKIIGQACGAIAGWNPELGSR
jgi:hypothetical protein